MSEESTGNSTSSGPLIETSTSETAIVVETKNKTPPRPLNESTTSGATTIKKNKT